MVIVPLDICVYVLALPERTPDEGLLLVPGELPQVANGEVSSLLLAPSLLPPASAYTSPPLPFPAIRNSISTRVPDLAFTILRIRIQLFTKMIIRIQPLTTMRTRIQLFTICGCGSGSSFSLYADADPDPVFHYMRIRIQFFTNYKADPDPAFHYHADPDPPLHYNADPDPAFHFNADPDPAPLQRGLDPPGLLFEPPGQHCKRPRSPMTLF